MKLTVAKTKEFFNLIKDTDKDNFEEVKTMLQIHTELANAVVSKMAKGIDGFSALMLAVRYNKFKIAGELIKVGADVNYIDQSPVRPYHFPVFFDLIEMLKNIIEAQKKDMFNEGMQLWELMELNGLDYTLTSTEPISDKTPENCVGAFIRNGATKYGKTHRIYKETQSESPFNTTFRLSEENRDIQKEKLYEIIIRKILSKVSEASLNDINCNSYRGYSPVMVPFYETEGFVDYFSLELCNKCVKEMYGYELKNYNDTDFLKKLSGNITRFAIRN